MLTKPELRARMAALRRLPRGLALLKPFLSAVPRWRAATQVAGYQAIRGELPATSALYDAHMRGVHLVFPRVDGEELRFHRWDGSPLVPGPFGIREPSATLPVVSPSELDVILVPGVAFDRAGNRLGYGGGYYDRVLAQPRGLAIGVAWSFQIVDALPVDPWDQPVDAILTESGWVLEPSSAGPDPRQA